ncbi:hypothetical protein L873DRAFT_780496 [Choiromyces venosus 120613-1]|uniref:Uncharacterized protein n=1 Tax=Choiromyces venosus 120613-1 TaxID=1336337 RepID=A0A3N4JTQ1_9PEZI|nr:hypothetical protein L873DRAFT_780496 [Choiromyces venosus 120613-1]
MFFNSHDTISPNHPYYSFAPLNSIHSSLHPRWIPFLTASLAKVAVCVYINYLWLSCH